MRHNSAITPLRGAKVLDFTRVLAGPMCTMMLGDLGADVIKVERPGGGDDSRGWGPPFDPAGFSAYFLSVNRNKKSIVLDLRQDGDRAVVAALLDQADVVVDNFIPGTLERFGLEVETWLSRRPNLLWCSITGFGPDSTRPGYDYVVQAERGWMSVTGEADGPPLRTGVAYADLFAGKDAAIAILASLAAVGRGTALPTGERRLFVSLAHSASAALINVAQNALITGSDARRHGNSHPNLVPYKLFDTADRPIVLAVGNDSQWRACITAIGGLEDLLAERALDTNAGRVGARERVIARLDARLREAGSEHWIEVLSRAGVPCGRLRSVLESLDFVAASPLTGIAPATGGVVRFAPPHLDEHGEQIRRDGWGVFRCAESHDFPRGNGDQVGMEPPVTAP